MAQRVAADREVRAKSRAGRKRRTESRVGHFRAGGVVSRADASGINSDGLYKDPTVYDILHEPGTDAEIRMLERVWWRVSAESPRTALEPACGTGRYLTRMARAGWAVRGFDIDPAMVKFSRERLRAQNTSGWRVWADRFDTFGGRIKAGSIGLAFCPINSIRHVSSDAELVRHLKAIRRVLAPNGVYAVGISLSAYGLEAPTEDVWSGSRRGVRIKQVVSYTPAAGGSNRRNRAERVDSVLEIRQRGRVEIRSSSYSLLSYSREQWEAAIAKSGMRTIGMVNEFASEFDPGRIGYAIWLLATPEHPLAGKQGIRGLRRSD